MEPNLNTTGIKGNPYGSVLTRGQGFAFQAKTQGGNPFVAAKAPAEGLSFMGGERLQNNALGAEGAVNGTGGGNFFTYV